MPAGFESWGPLGYTQITDDYANFMLKQKLVLSTPGGAGIGNTAAAASFTVTGAINPIIAFRSTGFAAIDSVIVSGSNWTFHILHTGTSLTVYVFDSPAPDLALGDFGLQVFKEDGTIAFDSTRKYAKIRSIVSVAAPFPTSLSFPYNFNEVKSVVAPAGPTYAAAMAYMRDGTYLSGSDSFADHYAVIVDSVAVNGNTISMGMIKTGSEWFTDPGGGPGFDYARRSSPPPILLFDVGGL